MIRVGYIVAIILVGVWWPLQAFSSEAEARRLLERAHTEYAQKRYAEAEAAVRRALTIAEVELGPDHSLTLRILEDYGSGLIDLKRHADAEPLLKRAIEGYARTVGSQHVDLARALNQLGRLYLIQSRHDEAEVILREAVRIYGQQQAVDRNAPAALFNLGAVYMATGQFQAAEGALKLTLDMRMQFDGPTDVATFGAAVMLVSAWLSSGQIQQGRAVAERLTEAIKRTYGVGHPLYVESAFWLGFADALQGDFVGAERMLRHLNEVQNLAETQDDRVVIRLISMVGLYNRQGRAEEAVRTATRAVELVERAFSDNRLLVSITRAALGKSYHRAKRFADAVPLLENAAAIMLPMRTTARPGVLWWLALAYRDNARLENAQQAIEAAILESERLLGPDNAFLPDYLLTWASIAERLGKAEAAERAFRRVVDVHRRSSSENHPNVAEAWQGLARLHASAGRTAEAIQEIRQATELLRQRGSGVDEESVGATTEQRDVRPIYLTHVELLARSPDAGAVAESFEVAQLANLSAAGRALATLMARFAAGTDDLAQLVRERQDALGRLAGLNNALTQLLEKSASNRKPEIEAGIKNDIRVAREAAETIRRKIGDQFPKFGELTEAPVVPVREVQSLLGADEAMISYLVAEHATYLWVVRADRSDLMTLPVGSKHIATEIAAIRLRLDPQLNPGLLPVDVERLHELQQDLVAPAVPRLAGIRHLLVVADGPLASLPFGALVLDPPKKADDYRTVVWMARKYAVTVLPTAGALRSLRGFGQTTRAPAPFLGIGNPKLEGLPGQARGGLSSLLRGGIADVDAVRRLSPLPETADELAALARAQGVSDEALMLGDQASEVAVKGTVLDRYRTLAFATHGLVAGELSGLAEPALVLTPPAAPSADDDGLLTASEIAQLRLNADWVILSACNTAAPDGTAGAEGLSGLARAFFYAGSRALLVSHWPIRSQAAVKLTTGALDELRKEPGIGRAEALRRAEMALLDDVSLPVEFTHPAAWAPFFVVGEGAAGR